MPQYLTPAGGFAAAFQDALTADEQRRQQDLENQIALQRERRLERAALEAEHEARQKRLDNEQDRQEERARKLQDQKDKEQKDKQATYEKRKSQMVPGDIPDPEMLQLAQEFGDNPAFPKPVDTRPAEMQQGVDQMAPPALRLAEPAQGPIQQQPPAVLPQEPVDRPYAGSPAQRGALRLAKMSGDPKDPEYRAALIEEYLSQGKAIPAGLFSKETAAPDRPVQVLKQNRRTGKVETRLDDGSWTVLQGPPAKDAHWITETDTGMADAANADRDERRVQSVRESATKDFEALAKPLEGSMKDFERVGTLLNMNNRQADAELAAMLTKALVQGGDTGSGFRMSQAAIDNTLEGGKTAWEKLKAGLTAFGADQDPKILEAQRGNMKKMALAVRSYAYKMHEKILNAQYEAGQSDDVKHINALRTILRRELFPAETQLGSDTTTPTGSAPSLKAEDIMKQIKAGRK